MLENVVFSDIFVVKRKGMQGKRVPVLTCSNS